MNRKYLNAIIYGGIFGVAYGSFFYERYTTTPSASEPAVIAELIRITSPNTTSDNRFMLPDGEDNIKHEASDVPQNAPAFNKGKKGALKQGRSSAPVSSPAIYTYTEKSHNRKRTTPLHEERHSRLMTAFTSAPAAHYAPNNTAVESNTAELKNYFPATNNNSTTKGLNEQSLSESDGSQFLPDGSSQQDLFISQSKNPRVYTIKDYRNANISCAPGYDDSSPHAKLMRGLKGCP